MLSLCASALQSEVLPVPGGPCSRTTLHAKERWEKGNWRQSNGHYLVKSVKLGTIEALPVASHAVRLLQLKTSGYAQIALSDIHNPNELF